MSTLLDRRGRRIGRRVGRWNHPLRPLEIDGEIARVPLANGRGEAIIDAKHAGIVGQFNWSGHQLPQDRTPYAKTWVSIRANPKMGYVMSLHRLIWFLSDATGDPPHIDHIDGDGLNNRESNLRGATVGQNQYNARLRRDNKSGIKGVRLKDGRWHAHITANGRQRHLGTFATRDAAADAVASARAQLHGEFARTA